MEQINLFESQEFRCWIEEQICRYYWPMQEPESEGDPSSACCHPDIMKRHCGHKSAEEIDVPMGGPYIFCDEGHTYNLAARLCKRCVKAGYPALGIRLESLDECPGVEYSGLEVEY